MWYTEGETGLTQEAPGRLVPTATQVQISPKDGSVIIDRCEQVLCL
jgi:hypothetical protein